MSRDTYLIDMDGKTVHTWRGDCTPALGATLLENGHLLRAGGMPNKERPFECSGGGGRVQEFDWSGELVWDFRLYDDRHLPHHDALKLPNGNVLLVMCERIPAAEALAAGRRADTLGGEYLLSDYVAEVKPTGKTTGEVVWQWRVWDHLVQEHDRGKPNYAAVADHPELIDLNFAATLKASVFVPGPDLAKLQGLGYVGSSAGGTHGAGKDGDWTHLNSVAYHPGRDEVAVTGLGFSEVWVIDHSTTRAEAAGHTGGKAGRGGDLLYRWGNPRTYRHGADQRLNGPHSAQWIAPGLPGAGHLLVFNNGHSRPDTRVSSVEEIDPPVDAGGRYARGAKAPFGPEKSVWHHTEERGSGFFSMTFSGAQRLPNGNTLVCLGLPGVVVEVTPEGETVWKYTLAVGPPGAPAPPRPPLGGRPRPPLPGGTPVPPSAPPGMPGPPPGPPASWPDNSTVPGTSLFRALRYAPDYPGLAGKKLDPVAMPSAPAGR
jgi:hypothetical protein